MDYGHMWWATIKPNQKSNLSLFILNNHKKEDLSAISTEKSSGSGVKMIKYYKFAISIYPW